MSMAQVAFRGRLWQDRVPARAADSIAGAHSGDQQVARSPADVQGDIVLVRAFHCSRTLIGAVTSTKDLGCQSTVPRAPEMSPLFSPGRLLQIDPAERSQATHALAGACHTSDDASVPDRHDAVLRSHLVDGVAASRDRDAQPMACHAHACGSGLSAAGRISEAYGRRHRRHRCYPWYRPRSPMPRYRGRQCSDRSDRE
jgi:hypothetical protein